jgi:hypothetical protein
MVKNIYLLLDKIQDYDKNLFMNIFDFFFKECKILAYNKLTTCKFCKSKFDYLYRHNFKYCGLCDNDLLEFAIGSFTNKLPV